MLAALLAAGLWSGTLFAQNDKAQAEKLREIVTEAEGFVAFGWPQMVVKNGMFENKVKVFFNNPETQSAFDFYHDRFYNMASFQEKIMNALKAKSEANEGISFADLCKDTAYTALVGCDFEAPAPEDKLQDTTWLTVVDKENLKHKLRLTEFTLRDTFKLYCYAAYNELKAADDVDMLVDLAFLARTFGLIDEAKSILDEKIVPMANNKKLSPEQEKKIAHLKNYIAEKDGVRSGQVPPEMVKLGDYAIDKYEYSDHGRHAGRDPMVNVSWSEAQLLCERQGKRLCTGTEWVEACRGLESNVWPYGKTADPNACSTGKYVTKGIEKLFQPASIGKVGSMPKCVTPSGIFDMSGNVWEWTSGKNTENPKPNERLAFGGSSFSSPENAKCSDKTPYDMSKRFLTVGFRCCFGKPKLGIYEKEVPNAEKPAAKAGEKAEEKTPATPEEPAEERIEAKGADSLEKKPAAPAEEKPPVEKAPEKQ
jgi:hypothetical protein